MTRCSPAFIAIIGYTFGRSNDGHDDCVSLDVFKDVFRGYGGDVYVLEPHPEPLSEMLADSIESNRVFGIRAYWNVLAHAFMRSNLDGDRERSLSYICEEILDKYGDRVVFPLTLDRNHSD